VTAGPLGEGPSGNDIGALECLVAEIAAIENPTAQRMKGAR
jgi:hypothetical protein